MANRQRRSSTIEFPAKAKKFRGEAGESIKIKPGDRYIGIYQGSKVITIFDKQKKEDKEVKLYEFRNEAGKKEGVLGRPMLDSAFEEMFAGSGGESGVIGSYVGIERGDDTDLEGGRSLGNYDVFTWDK